MRGVQSPREGVGQEASLQQTSVVSQKIVHAEATYSIYVWLYYKTSGNSVTWIRKLEEIQRLREYKSRRMKTISEDHYNLQHTVCGKMN